MHRCTDADFAKFYPPEEATRPRVEKIQKEGGFFCFDLQQDREIYGSLQVATNAAGLDIMPIPCGSQYQL